MRTLMYTALAAAFMLVAASAYAGMSSYEVNSFDSSGYTVVSINEPSSPIMTSSHETVTLDSNGLWLASDYSNVKSDKSLLGSSGMEHSNSLYCFDFNSRFCAVAY